MSTSIGRPLIAVEMVDAVLRGKVEVGSLHGARSRLTSQVGSRLFDFYLVCGNQKVEPFARANARKLVADPRRCAGHDCKRPFHLCSPLARKFPV
ncbi:hypothetical protein ABIF26_005448 [Bradyrhizobium elkanii]|uniref:Uncharacterized protein n=1 Tax=Bradyrhizobium elkanii TaxID=29448 RepID=A0A8I1Y443_BRAEL|nr:hypothetical protein [Bradyrhizobium elkanii]